MTVAGMLRVKNEERWIERVLLSLRPVCSYICIFDDHSTDDTVGIIRRVSKRHAFEEILVEVLRSPFEELDEARDKTWLAKCIMNECSPDWILAIDGDEELSADQVPLLLKSIASGRAPAYRLKIRYLWNDQKTERVDGIYGRFYRPSLFLTSGTSFDFRTGGGGGSANFHCSNVPADRIGHAIESEAALLHYGYMLQEDRIRKYHWYNRIDSGNELEDRYRHMIAGDLPEVPAECRTKHAGPLTLKPV